MKKCLVLLLAILLVGIFAACGGGGSSPIPEGLRPPMSPLPTFTPPPGFPDLLTPSESEVSGFTIVEDLPAINLINHDLSDSDLLEAVTFRTLLGAEIADVTIISEYDDLEHENAHIFNDAWAIELYYFARRHETAVESVIRSFEADVEAEWFFPDSHLEISDIRATSDHQMAHLVVIEEFTNGIVRVLIYMAQNVPGSNDVVLLDVVLYPHLWEEYDEAVLSELSFHIGLDLRVYLREFVEQQAQLV